MGFDPRLDLLLSLIDPTLQFGQIEIQQDQAIVGVGGKVLGNRAADAFGRTGDQNGPANGIFNPPLTDRTSPVRYKPRSARYSTASAISSGSA